MKKLIFIFCLIPVMSMAQFTKEQRDALTLMADSKIMADLKIDSTQSLLNSIDSLNSSKRHGIAIQQSVFDSLRVHISRLQVELDNDRKRGVQLKSDIPYIGKWRKAQ